MHWKIIKQSLYYGKMGVIPLKSATTLGKKLGNRFWYILTRVDWNEYWGI